MTPSLVCTVSTVKDSVANLRAFVRRNLAAGADHVLLFVDDADPDTHQALAELDHVTAVRTGKGYWHGRRPTNLNTRQVVNANVAALALAAAAPQVRWLFHLDGDECLDVDRDHLLALGPEVRAVRLRTLEAVSQERWDRDVDRFKRQLEWEDLCLLHALRVIDKPKMSHYFHGHVGGKSGMRPGVDTWLGVHRVLDATGEKIEPHESDDLHVLHYESYSGEEFVRKWAAHLSAAGEARFTQRKDRMRSAIEAVHARDLPEPRRLELLLQIYRFHIEDDLEQLEALGMLTTPAPERHSHRPAGLGRRELARLRHALAALRGVDKRLFTLPQPDPPRAEVLAALLAEVDPLVEDAEVRARLHALLAPVADPAPPVEG